MIGISLIVLSVIFSAWNLATSIGNFEKEVEGAIFHGIISVILMTLGIILFVKSADKIIRKN